MNIYSVNVRQHKTALLFAGLFVVILFATAKLLQTNEAKLAATRRVADTLSAQLSSVYQHQAPLPEQQSAISCPQFIATRTLGDRDAGRINDIRTVQAVLVRHFKLNRDNTVNGVYNSETAGIVARFQAESELATTGILDEATVNKLTRICTSEQPTHVSGFDYNLMKRCIRSYDAKADNYYNDIHDCTTKDNNWTLSIQALDGTGQPCGPDGQSFPINIGDSPIGIVWSKLPTSNWSVTLRSDFAKHQNPCASGTTKVIFADDTAHGGGPLPRPMHAMVNAHILPTITANNGRGRIFSTFTGLWDGRAYTIDVVLNSANGLDMYPDDMILLQKSSTPAADIFTVDGRAFGASITGTISTLVEINWQKILETMVTRGLIPTPQFGWDTAATRAIGFGQETIDPGNAGPIAVTQIDGIMISNR